jgi:extracellular elastinolytic metalloproteinase
MGQRSRRAWRRHLIVLTASTVGIMILVPAGPGADASSPVVQGVTRSIPGEEGFVVPLGERAASGVPGLQDPGLERARAAMAGAVGGQVVLSFDPNGWLHWVARIDGSLTGPSAAAPADIALGFLRTYRRAFGVRHADFATLRFRNDYVDIEGTHHLSWVQRTHGRAFLLVGLKAAVAADGSLLELSGPLGTGLAVPGHQRIQIGPDAAIADARAAAGARPTAARNDTATMAWYPIADAPSRPAWDTTTTVSAGEVDRSIVDARTGKILWRANLVESDQTGSGYVWPAWPGTRTLNAGGAQVVTSFPVIDASALSGNDAHVTVAPKGNTREIPATDPSTLTWHDAAVFDTATTGQHCSAGYPCTWNYRVPYSWRTNMRQTATQLYALLNAFHDHLAAAPFGFTEAAGNFQRVNSSGLGLGHDPIVASADVLTDADGEGNPGPINNAGIYVPRDGRSPQAEFFLFRRGRRASSFPSVNSSDDATVVFHEYTHGLSNRLMTDAAGDGALWSFESASMGEGWSDWYALDALDTEGYLNDTPAVDLPVGDYVTGGQGIRTQFADCLVTSSPAECPAPASGTAGSGGYTYGDLARIVTAYPEVHAAGEVWLQTLWQLRNLLGPTATESIVTRAMELAPFAPTFLDMRDAILLADQVVYGGAHRTQIWQVFAERGMGMFARPSRWGRTFRPPHEDLSLPATCPGDPACGLVHGRVVDTTSHPVLGATVRLSGGAAGIPVELSATTDAGGRFEIDDVPVGRYPDLTFTAPGYLAVGGHITIHHDTQTGAQLQRDWASTQGGARVVGHTGRTSSEHGLACTPRAAFDMTHAGWRSRADGPRSVILRLPLAVNVSAFGFRAGSVCSTAATAVRAFDLWTRTGAHARWRLAYRTRDGFPPRVERSLHPRAGDQAVRFVRITLRSARNGGHVIGLGELSVLGSAAR